MHTDTMDDIDAALNELGMLSNVTSCRLEYLQASLEIYSRLLAAFRVGGRVM